LKVSVVTPSFNSVCHLQACVDSVVCQGYSNLEYILVDGASVDGTWAIIERNLHHFSHLVIEPDCGHWDALNKGFALATGEIMAWLNSDDLYMPWTLALVAEIFDRFPEVEWIQGLPAIFNAQGQLVEVHPKIKSRFDYLGMHYGWIQQESTFWRRSLWERAGGFISDQYRLMVDGELWSRFFDHAPLVRVDSVLAGFRLHATNRSLVSGEAPRAEMQHIIAAMRSRSSREDLRIAGRMLTARRLAHRLPIPSLFDSGFVYDRLCALLLGRDYSRVRYPVIHWSHADANWCLTSEPPA
jgi:glycosyltransferase involved in cell wall biosynthesis